jgi:isocitrate dehydrogenase (NAD+)
VSRAVTVIRGDGVGAEVVDAALAVLESSGVDLSLEVREAGAVANIKLGDALPDETLRSIRATGVCLRGPLEEPLGTGQSAEARLRAELATFASVQPVRSLTAGRTPADREVDLVIVREVSEGEYAGAERYADEEGDVVERLSTTTRSACQRVVQFAFAHALRARRRRVTLVHAGPSFRLASELFVDAGRGVASRYDGVAFDVMSVDEATRELVANPSGLGIVVAPGLCGTMLSSVATALGGGLGVAARMDVATNGAVFSPLHGTSPETAGKGLANPTASILAGAMMLRYLGENEAADAIESAVARTIAGGKHLTPDRGGRASTSEFGTAVASLVRIFRSEMTSRR